MSKPEWGIKRTCQACDVSFYDLKKDPIICPKCLSVYDEKALIEKHSVDLHEELEDLRNLAEDNDIPDDDFFLETPSDLIDALEDIDGTYTDKHALNG